jgi:putative transposase
LKEEIDMKDTKKASEIASNRMQLVAPLLQVELDAAEQRQLRHRIMVQTGLSERTLRRYLERYRENGYEGLLPKPRGQTVSTSTIPENLLQQAVLLRREVPGRSISSIIHILEMEGLAAPGQIRRTTLQDRLAAGGYSARHMRLYQSSSTAARRFQRTSRNDLWHADIKFGPYLPIGPNGEKKQVHLVAFLDDATRFIVHAAFYPSLDQAIVQDCFRQAIAKYGVPSATFFDNGKQFRNRWMERACSKMGIRLLFAAPYSPEATGKIERFNRTVGQFLAEQHLEKRNRLDDINRNLGVWLEECYQSKPHGGLKSLETPLQAYQMDSKPLRFLAPEVVSNAFLHCEDRKVDKAGCISFAGRKYEAGLNFVGNTVQVVYDLADTSVLTLEYKNHPSWQARELVIGTRTGPRPILPERMTPLPADGSRLLTAATEKNDERRARQYSAVSYRRGRGGDSHV